VSHYFIQTLVSAVVARAVGAGAAPALQLLDELLPRLHEQQAAVSTAAATVGAERLDSFMWAAAEGAAIRVHTCSEKTERCMHSVCVTHNLQLHIVIAC
jgi:hypothetical protein